jgi:putative transposase
MSRYRRAKQEGGTFFFTVVTYRRRHLFDQPVARHVLREVIQKVREKHPFLIDAWVLLPDHLHCIWTLPLDDYNYSLRWNLIKSTFSRESKLLYHDLECSSDSRRVRREAAIWQRRFWEHQIRDDQDYRIHVDYIHYNPVKHGWVTRVKEWPFSTFHRFVSAKIYPENWGGDMEKVVDGRFGE